MLNSFTRAVTAERKYKRTKELRQPLLSNRNSNASGSRALAFWLLLSFLLVVTFVLARRLDLELESRVLPAVVLSSIFALLAFVLRGVSRSGASAGALIAFVQTAAGGLPMFGMLALVFALTWLATRLGRERKLRLGVAEQRRGRDGAQVLANLWAAAMAITLSLLLPCSYALHIAAMAALVEAASDTASSEIGQAFGRRAWLITTGGQVPVGTDGGVSMMGILAGLLAAIIVALASIASGELRFSDWPIITLCGFIGMIFDSFIGAMFERRGWMTNNAVNFSSTCFSALLAFVIGINR